MKMLPGILVSALFALALLELASAVHAEPAEDPQNGIPLYEGVAPGSEAWMLHESACRIFGNKVVRNVVQPTLTVFAPEPDKAVGTAVIIAPGGAMMFLSIESEGYAVARWLAARGVTAFVLKYRTVQTTEDDTHFGPAMGKLFGQLANPKSEVQAQIAAHTPLAVADGKQAVLVVRSLAARYGFSPDRVVTVGFSAGGRVAIGGTLQPNADCRPNYSAWIYSAVAIGEADGEYQISTGMPPVFMAVAANDSLVGSLQVPLYERLKRAGVPVELHIFEKGSHGFGMNIQGKTSDHWIDEFYWWMESHGLTKKVVIVPPAPSAMQAQPVSR